MTDPKLPEPSDEFLSSRPHSYSKTETASIKSFKNRLQLARTLIALAALRHDIERSNLQNNAQAKDELRKITNEKAGELGFKEKGESGRWWN